MKEGAEMAEGLSLRGEEVAGLKVVRRIPDQLAVDSKQAEGGHLSGSVDGGGDVKVDQHIIEPIGKPFLCVRKAGHSMLPVQPPKVAAGGAPIREIE